MLWTFQVPVGTATARLPFSKLCQAELSLHVIICSADIRMLTWAV